MALNVREIFGDIDIYLFDQILKSRFRPGDKILDVGCGSGRNLLFFLRNGFEVFGVDPNPVAINQVRTLAANVSPNTPPKNFEISVAESLGYNDEEFDSVICSAVLHFADNEEHFRAMFSEVWRVLKKNGLFFSRLASSIGIEDRIKPIEGRRFLIPDGSERFLVDEQMLVTISESIGATLLEPIKTTNVQNLRCMTTWVLRKP
ncbi:MAG: class I SAM-dependent methyltransferase [Pyrinomonadaceae bacterium]|nr:class I SAM-dependent methyltransferase [Pyrinomonadaceae bacterium]